MKIPISSILSFPEFYSNVKKSEISIQTAHKLFQLKSEIEPHIAFYKESFQKIVETFSEKDENGEILKTPDGEGIKIKKESEKACSEKINELVNFQIEISDIFFELKEFEEIKMPLYLFETIFIFIR